MKIPFQMCHLTVVCADVSSLLFNLNLMGVDIHNLSRIDDLTASFYIRQNQLKKVSAVLERSGGRIITHLPASMYILLKGFCGRPVLIIGAVLLLFLTFYLPTRILFVTVSGNERIPQRQIVDVAAECGVRFGVARRELRSEAIKNRMLSSLPALKWVGVTSRGCVAEISVRERAPTETKVSQETVSSIVASHDGVIREMTVRSGNPICHVGEAVKKGQLLVSGYADCGRCIYGTRSDAEIYAQTRRTLNASVLTDGLERAGYRGSRRKYGLIIGKKRINFYKGSGIYDATCVRMYMEYPLTLPGGFQLPVLLTVQEELNYDTVSAQAATEEAELILNQFARDYLKNQMIAGKVEQGSYHLTESDGVLHLTGRYICQEMIGLTYSEEITNDYEQTN